MGSDEIRLRILIDFFLFASSLHRADHPIPHTAAAWLSDNGQDAYFAMAYQTNLMLFTMNAGTGQTTSVELKQQYIVPRIFSNITGALR